MEPKNSYSMLASCIAMCKKDIENIYNVPKCFATMALFSQLDKVTVESNYCLKMLLIMAPDAQDHYIQVWYKHNNFSFNKLMKFPGCPNSKV